jgi:hypothetical protein
VLRVEEDGKKQSVIVIDTEGLGATD